MQAKVSEWNNLLGLRTTDYIVISKSKSVLHSAFQSYSFISHCTLRSPTDCLNHSLARSRAIANNLKNLLQVSIS